MTKKYKIGVIDTETDPFKHLRVPKPFAAQFKSADHSEQFWGPNCIDGLAAFLEKLEDRYYIFAHNGGKFDFHFMHKYLDNPIRVINSRIVSASMFHHTLRDSFAILPVPLRDYKKDDTNYEWFEADKRERHKPHILRYLDGDCTYLLELVEHFIDQFGLQMTIGATAMKEIQKRHPSARLSAQDDAIYRKYYFGGRVQCFMNRINKGPFICVDVNSSYPYSMKYYTHPKNGTFKITNRIPDDFEKPYFVHFTGSNRGAIPCKAEDGSLNFEKPYGEFFACSHELKVAFKHNLVTIDKVHACHIAQETISMGDFVDYAFGMKSHGRATGNKAEELEGKLIGNSGYGKYGQNPENFSDWVIVRDPGLEGELMAEGYALDCEFPDFELWSRPAEVTDHAYYDVSIAASITSASRAVLLEGMQYTTGLAYCDTDSLICKTFSGPISNSELGKWKIEGESQILAIAGKKVYSMYDDPRQKNRDPRKPKIENGGFLKLASKGGTLRLEDILSICAGNTVTMKNAAPTFSLNHMPDFITRNFKMTVDTNKESADID